MEGSLYLFSFVLLCMNVRRERYTVPAVQRPADMDQAGVFALFFGRVFSVDYGGLRLFVCLDSP